MDLMSAKVINAAGKLTALGGSAQSQSVAETQAVAAQMHFDMDVLRREVAAEIADHCGAEAACVTSGAAAGLTIGVAAMLCRHDPALASQLPRLQEPQSVVIQAGHNINFGADIEQMVHLAGAGTTIAGTIERVVEADLATALDGGPSAMLYVQSHHCIQENRLALSRCVELAQAAEVPVMVDAAAEDDLRKYIAMGADLVTYSGGKAFGGPTSGFIVGRQSLIELCELQFRGIARPMKVSKEQLVGLAQAILEYTGRNHDAALREWENQNQTLLEAFADSPVYRLEIKPDEAGREFSRVAVMPKAERFDCHDLVRFLAKGKPSIRTRNHQVQEQRILIDPRELSNADLDEVIARLKAFEWLQ